MLWIPCEWKVVFYTGDMTYHQKKNQYQAGLSFAISYKKNTDFLGKDALLKIKDKEPAKKMTMLTLKNRKPGEPLLLHDEPIYLDDKIIGRTTSGNYSFNFNKNLTFGYVDRDLSNLNSSKNKIYIEVGKNKIRGGILSKTSKSKQF